MSSGSSSTQISSEMWSKPWSGARYAGPDLRRVGELALLEARKVRRESVGQLVGGACPALAQRPAGIRADRNSLAGSSVDRIDRADATLVRRIERAQRLDLVAKPLDADRQRLAGREHVDDAATARELATAGHLGHGLVAELDQLAQHALLADALARA